jgi:AraC-like DNA-binding protein
MADKIPVRYVQSTLQLFKQSRTELESLLADLELPVSLLDDPAGVTSLDALSYGRLFVALLKRSQQDLHGSPQMAEQMTGLSTYRLMFTYMLQAENLHDAITRAAAYFLRFHEKKQGFTLDVADNYAVWHFNLDSEENSHELARLEHFCMGNLNWLPGLSGRVSALYVWHRLASWLIGQFIDLDAVNIDCALHGDAEEFIQPFRAPVYFNQSDCSLRFHVRYLEFPIVQDDAGLNNMLDTFPAELMRADEMADSTAARVRALFGQDYSQDLPNLEKVAECLFTTPPTLHRRLSSEGTSFQQIKDACRRDAAVALLRAGSKSGADIAELLGFSDASTFYRAFKRWTGMTAQEFRQRET